MGLSSAIFRNRCLRAVRLLLLAALLFASLAGWSAPANQLHGTVRDQSGAVVPFAQVVLQAGDQTYQQTADANGAFAFSIGDATAGEITVSAAGFATVNLPWNASQTELAITLSLAPLQQTLQVTATRTPILPTGAEDITLQPGVSMLPSAQLNQWGAITIDDKLRQVPGFSLLRRSGSMTANPTSQGVSLRGLSANGSSRALVLKNGIPLNDPFGSWIFWGRVPVASLSEVQVVPGGISSLYGNDALGGVINLETRSAVQTNLAAEGSYGNENTPFGSAFAGVRFGQWAVAGSGEGFNTDGYITVPPDQRGSVDTPVSSQHGTGDLQIERFFGAGAGTGTGTGPSGGPSSSGRVFLDGTLYGENRHNGTPLQINSTTLRELAFGLDYASKSAGLFTLRLFGGTESYHQTFSSIAPGRNSESLTDNQHVPVQHMGLIAQWSRALSQRITLLAGLDAQAVEGFSDEQNYLLGRPTAFVSSGGSQQSLGAFLETVVQLSPRWSLTASAREDLWSNFDASTTRTPTNGNPSATIYPARGQNAFDPRLTLACRVGENFTLYASGYRSFRAPTLNELYRGFRVGNVQTLANAYLLAERFTGAEAGLRGAAFHGRLSYYGTFFWGIVTNPIANVTLSSTNLLIVRQRQNLGEIRAPGMQLGTSIQILPSLALSAAYQYVDSTVVSFPANPALVGNLVPLVSRNDFSFQATWSAPREFLVAVQGRTASNEFDDDQNLLPLGGYFVLSASLSHPLPKGLSFFVAAENLTNSSYEIARTPVVNLGQPILVRAGLRWQSRR